MEYSSLRLKRIHPCPLLCLVINLASVAADAETYKIYLNSYANCGHEKTYEVSLKKEYLIRPDVSPDTGTNSFRDCEVTFHSPQTDGHVCLILEGAEAKILDSNAQLHVFDGLGSSDDEVIGHLKPYPNTWAKRDVCSKTRFITFYLHRIQKANLANIRQVQFTFRIVDIESSRRKLYLDGTYCDNEYDLLNSQISLHNRPDFSGMAVAPLTSECAMLFRKAEASSNSSICVVYIPSSNVTCDSNWRFVVSSAKYDVREQYIVYSLKCDNPKANEMHAWCGSVEHSLVTVAFWRDDGILSNSSLERPGAFRFLITDFEGSADELLKKVKASMIVHDAVTLGTFEIVLICICILLVVILIVIVYVNRKRLPCYDYKAVNKEDSTAGNEAHL